MNEERKKEILKRGIACFNRREFFDCHEVLEEVWLAEAPEENPSIRDLFRLRRPSTTTNAATGAAPARFSGVEGRSWQPVRRTATGWT